MEEVKPGQKLTDLEAMRLAITVAEKGWGFVSPNPAVGCVIVDNNNCFLASGYHERHGGPHAEVNALKNLSSESLKGARVFVTLEPCAHYGKTPPCAEALAKLPLAEVIFGLMDPNPLVQGKGAEIIRKAGIKATHFQLLQGDLEKVCEHFLKNMRHQLPFVSIKVASSLDGKLALKNGQSQWITGPEAREKTHHLRGGHDAILVGVNTFLTDNPSLDIRHPSFPDKINRVIVLDPSLRGAAKIKNSKLMSNHTPDQIFWVTHAENETSALEDLNVNVLKLPRNEKGEDLDLLLLKKKLWSLGLRSLLVEGGGATISSFINQKAVDRLYVFMAPVLVGDKAGLSWTSELDPINNLEDSLKLSKFEMSTHGKDLLLTSLFP